MDCDGEYRVEAHGRQIHGGLSVGWSFGWGGDDALLIPSEV